MVLSFILLANDKSIIITPSPLSSCNYDFATSIKVSVIFGMLIDRSRLFSITTLRHSLSLATPHSCVALTAFPDAEECVFPYLVVGCVVNLDNVYSFPSSDAFK